MAFQVGTACYSTEAGAAFASASERAGALVQAGGTAYVVEVGSAGPSSITYVLHPVDGSAALTVATPYNPVPCGLLTWQDGLNMAWMVAAAWLATAAVLYIGRAVSGWGGKDGDA